MEPVPPELGRAGHDRVLEVEPPRELLLADGERMRIGAGLDLVAERRAAALERLEGRARRRVELVPEARRVRAQRGGQLHDQLAAAAEHGERGIHEHRWRRLQRGPRRVEKPGDRAEPLEPRGRTPTRRLAGAGEHGVETLEQMVDPEHRIPFVGSLVLQPEDAASDLAEQRGPVDLLLQVVHLELFHRARHRAQRRDVRAHRGIVELAQPAVVRHQPGGAPGGGIEVVLEVQVGPAELVDGHGLGVRPTARRSARNGRPATHCRRALRRRPRSRSSRRRDAPG